MYKIGPINYGPPQHNCTRMSTAAELNLTRRNSTCRKLVSFGWRGELKTAYVHLQQSVYL